MKTTITAKLKLKTTPQQFAQSRKTQLAYRDAQQDWIGTGTLSEYPDMSSTEAKAARLKRYAELRWSLDTRVVRK